LGTVIGSFLNVVIYRLPRGQNLSYPGSSCPICKEKIKWYDNVPILSYIALGGKCRVCKTKISIQYPFVELLAGFLFLLVYVKFGYSILTIKYFIFVSILISVSIIDIKSYFIPDSLTFSLILLGMISAFFSNINLESAFIGAGAYAFFFIIIYGYGEYIFKKEAMGFGDIKLGAGVGAYIGYTTFYNFYIFLTIAFVAGAIISVLLIILKIRKREELVPFGPYIALSAFICLMILG